MHTMKTGRKQTDVDCQVSWSLLYSNLTCNNRVDSSVTGQRDGKEERKMMMMKEDTHARTQYAER